MDRERSATQARYEETWTNLDRYRNIERISRESQSERKVKIVRDQ